MSDVFHLYERQYSELSVNLSKKCSLAFSLKGGQKEEKLSEITSDLDNAEKLITKMDHAASSLPIKIKSILIEKIRESKSDLKRLKSEIKRNTYGNFNTTTTTTTTSRDEFLEADRAASAYQRSRLMKSTEGLARTTEKIKDSRRKMLETEQIGILVLQNLHSQRQFLECSNETLYGVDANLTESRSILTSMKIMQFIKVAGPIILYFLFKLAK